MKAPAATGELSKLRQPVPVPRPPQAPRRPPLTASIALFRVGTTRSVRANAIAPPPPAVRRNPAAAWPSKEGFRAGSRHGHAQHQPSMPSTSGRPADQHYPVASRRMVRLQETSPPGRVLACPSTSTAEPQLSNGTGLASAYAAPCCCPPLRLPSQAQGTRAPAGPQASQSPGWAPLQALPRAIATSAAPSCRWGAPCFWWTVARARTGSFRRQRLTWRRSKGEKG